MMASGAATLHRSARSSGGIRATFPQNAGDAGRTGRTQHVTSPPGTWTPGGRTSTLPTPTARSRPQSMRRPQAARCRSVPDRAGLVLLTSDIDRSFSRAAGPARRPAGAGCAGDLPPAAHRALPARRQARVSPRRRRGGGACRLRSRDRGRSSAVEGWGVSPRTPPCACASPRSTGPPVASGDRERREDAAGDGIARSRIVAQHDRRQARRLVELHTRRRPRTAIAVSAGAAITPGGCFASGPSSETAPSRRAIATPPGATSRVSGRAHSPAEACAKSADGWGWATTVDAASRISASARQRSTSSTSAPTGCAPAPCPTGAPSARRHRSPFPDRRAGTRG